MLDSILGSLSFPYHEPREGFWGDKTVTLNFCEEDYVISYYCAEFCNVRRLSLAATDRWPANPPLLTDLDKYPLYLARPQGN